MSFCLFSKATIFSFNCVKVIAMLQEFTKNLLVMVHVMTKNMGSRRKCTVHVCLLLARGGFVRQQSPSLVSIVACDGPRRQKGAFNCFTAFRAVMVSNHFEGHYNLGLEH